MNLHDDQQKRNALENLLYELASGQDVLKELSARSSFYQKLEEIYYNSDDDNFRHLYSDIFSWLTIIDGDPSRGDIDTLAQNMEIIKDEYQGGMNVDGNGNSIDISKEIIKLYDHINLDVGRLNYTKRNNDITKSQLLKVESLIGGLEDKIKQINNSTEEIKKELKEESERKSQEIMESQRKMQNEYITILGIFAAIVLAFTGGMTFSSSVLENLHKSSIYRIIFVTLIIGCILYNLIWLLLDFIRNINRQTMRKWWMLWLFNCLFLGLMLFTGLSYKFDWFSREEMINHSSNGMIIEERITAYSDF